MSGYKITGWTTNNGKNEPKVLNFLSLKRRRYQVKAHDDYRGRPSSNCFYLFILLFFLSRFLYISLFFLLGLFNFISTGHERVFVYLLRV